MLKLKQILWKLLGLTKKPEKKAEKSTNINDYINPVVSIKKPVYDKQKTTRRIDDASGGSQYVETSITPPTPSLVDLMLINNIHQDDIDFEQISFKDTSNDFGNNQSPDVERPDYSQPIDNDYTPPSDTIQNDYNQQSYDPPSYDSSSSIDSGGGW